MPTVLLVEDVLDISTALSRRLTQRGGFQVLVAPNGEAAMRLAEQHLPQVIIMDMVLEGGVSGLDAIKRLRATPATAQIPIIAVSASYIATFRDDAIRAGASDVDTKPFDTDRIIAKIRALLPER